MSHRKTVIKRPVNDASIELEIAIHPASNGKMVLNYPGITGDIDGYNNKYGQLADLMQERGICTVVRMGNRHFPELPYPEGMIDNFRFVINHCITDSKELCGTKDPVLYLMGFSAGASVVAAIAGDYREVEKILLMAPSGDVERERVKASLSKFKGDVYIAVGEKDEIVGSEAGQKYYELATGARYRELQIIPDCDHQFRGETNGRIMSKAPLWAFLGDSTFPSPDGGKKLYD